MSESNANPAEGNAAPKGGLVGKLAIAVFMAAVVGAECFFAYFCIPSADDVKARAAAQAAQDPQEGEDGQASSTAQDESEEVDLGMFNITAHQSSADVTLRIDFHLVGTVNSENKSEFDRLFKRNEHRFREQVLFEMRGAEVTDLDEPGLGLIKRRILEKSNALFGTSLLESVVISDFSFVEQ